MTETTTTDTGELADLLIDLARYANSVAAQCRDLATTRGDLHITNQYGLVASQAADAAGRAIGWARQLRDSHAIIVGHWPVSDERGHDLGPTIDGVQTVRGDTIEHQDHVGDDWPIIIERGHDIPDAGHDEISGDVVYAWGDEPYAYRRADRDEAHDATWSDRDDDRDEDVRS